MVDSQDGSLRVRLFIFSGRPDPEWSLTGQAAADLAQRVRRTIGGEEIYPSAPAGLGYRGFLVRTGGPDAGVPRELTVFRGVVTEQPGPRARHWRDEDLLLHICLLRPYVPFIPLEGPQANPFFPGGKDSPRNKALVQYRTEVLNFIETHVTVWQEALARLRDQTPGAAGEPQDATSLIHQWPRSIET